jgi:hypothetical protein
VRLVQHRLHGAVRHRLHDVDGGGQRAQRRDVLGAALEVADVEDDDADRGAALELSRDEVQRGSRDQREAAAQRVGRVGHELAVRAHDLAGTLARPQQHAAEHERTDGPQRELELDHDAEVAAAAAQRPEQVGVLGRRRRDHLAGRGHHARRAQVVGRQAHPALEPAAAGAEREAGDAGARGAPAGDGEAVLLRRCVELGPQHAGLHPGDAAGRVNVDRLQRAEVDQQAAVGGAEAGSRMPTPAHRDLHPVLTRVEQRGGHVGDRLAARDQRRVAVDHAVVDAPGVVIADVVGADQRAREAMDGRRGGKQQRHGMEDPVARLSPHRGSP